MFCTFKMLRGATAAMAADGRLPLRGSAARQSFAATTSAVLAGDDLEPGVTAAMRRDLKPADIPIAGRPAQMLSQLWSRKGCRPNSP